MSDAILGSMVQDGGPVVHLRRPTDRVTIILEPEPGYPGELLTPFKVRLTGEITVYDAPDGHELSRAPVGRVLDVFETRAGWWRVTQPPVRGMWVRAGRLAV